MLAGAGVIAAIIAMVTNPAMTTHDLLDRTPVHIQMRDLEGHLLDHLTADHQAILFQIISISLPTSAEKDVAEPFVAIFEVRNSDGVTVYVGWQNGTLTKNEQVPIGMSWVAESARDYEVRTFLVSNLANPMVLAEVISTPIVVADAGK